MTAEVLDKDWTFFAPVATDAIDELLSQYRSARMKIDEVAKMVNSDLGSVIGYFIQGNAGDEMLHRTLYVDKLFQTPGAIGALNASYWKRALDLTDVYDLMPQARRNEWNEQILHPLGMKDRIFDRTINGYKEIWKVAPLPDFEEETVRGTLMDLIHSRSRFFSERVDGIFRALSHEHVTNCPQGFSKRMIIANMFSFYSGGHTSSNYANMGIINDLRCVIAKFMGRDDPTHCASNSIIENARRDQPGQWIPLDGGALRIRVYLKGTAHVEIHPDMAWRLNSVLANLYPAAIPASFRTPPKRKHKEWQMIQRPLPFAVLSMLESLEPALRRVQRGFDTGYERIPNTLSFRASSLSASKALRSEVDSILAAIGGTPAVQGKAYEYWQFDYNPHEVIAQIVASGCLPDAKTHQFYPTMDFLADDVVRLADIQDGDETLEPSAGTGQIAKRLPPSTTCVEISALHCKVLESLGLANVVNDDFLSWATITAQRFDRIVMNPPFSEGRWQEHLSAAASLLKAGGRLVAILPASARGKDLIPGWNCEYSKPYDNAFPSASVSVVILTANKPR